MPTLPQPIAAFETTLALKMSAAASSFILTTATDITGNALSGTVGFIINEAQDDEEFIIGTVSGTTVTVVARGVDPQNPATEVSSLKKEHRRGATVKIVDYPYIGVVARQLAGTDGFANKLKYENSETLSDDKHFAHKDYVDGKTFATPGDASTSTKGYAKTSVAPAISSNPILVGDNDTRIPTADEKAALAGTDTPSGANKYVTEDNAALDNNVTLTGDQTIAGVKTFSSIPVLPATNPTTDNQLVRKAYIDALFN